MKNRLCSFLSQLALPGLAALLTLLLSPALALADTISTFGVSGSATNVSGGTLDSCAVNAVCEFSGTFQVDVTIGMMESSGLDITFPGLATFDSVVLEGPTASDWSFLSSNSSSDALTLDFSTAPTPGSLVGFTGGTILGTVVDNPSFAALYDVTGGSITPVPEPSPLVPLASGLAWLVFGLARKFGKNSAIR
jgi:hypothetical protein